VSFIRVVVWGRRAEVCGEYLSKGSPVFVEGRLQSRSWEGQDGQKRSTIEVIADNVQFLRGAASDKTGSASAKADAAVNDVATINLNDELGPIPDTDNNKGGKSTQGPDEAPF
jgi:single-strand DNA-binding protein